MEQKSSRKRHLFDDEDSDKQPMQKRVRFPKGKKVKPGNEVVDRVKDDDVVGPTDVKNPRLAATERASRRSQMTFELCSEESRGIANDISAAEVTYEANENFVDDGIHIEPFNLDKEREEGYFDADGNFVEYVIENEIKDAWLDSLEVDQRYVGTSAAHNKDVEVDEDEDDNHDLSSEELGMIKRRISDVLEQGETVTQALRRLKGTSNKKEKMSADTKRVFDQLTEDAMKLMEENGEFNVYNENRETFEREAEGYERLSQSKGKGTSLSVGQENSNANAENYLFSGVTKPGSASSFPSDSTGGNPSANLTASETARNADDAYDMFADDDDEDATAKPLSEDVNTVSGPYSIAISRSSSDTLNAASENGSSQTDYVYDESSGYYYSSSLGYYYDPSTGLYCSAASGQWYSFNEEANAYEEVNVVASSAN